MKPDGYSIKPDPKSVEELAKLALAVGLPVRHARGTSGYVIKGTTIKWNPLQSADQALHLLCHLCNEKDFSYIVSRDREKEPATARTRYNCHIYSETDCVASKKSYKPEWAICRALSQYIKKEKEGDRKNTAPSIGTFGKKRPKF